MRWSMNQEFGATIIISLSQRDYRECAPDGCNTTSRLTAGQHAFHELLPVKRAVAVFVLSSEEVGDTELFGADPRYVALPPEIEIEIFEALQFQKVVEGVLKFLLPVDAHSPDRAPFVL